MKTFFTFVLAFISASTLKAQVGINTTNPLVTMHVESTSTGASTAEGLLVPRLTLAQLISKDSKYLPLHDGTLIYITDITGGNGGSGSKTQNVNATGYYYFNGTEWAQMAQKNNIDFFYMPSVVLPTDPSDAAYVGSSFTIDLHKAYAEQFGLTNSASSIKNPAGTALSSYAKNELDYLVTYFDKNVYTNVSVSDNGILTYQIATGSNISEKTFMNIVLRVKK